MRCYTADIADTLPPGNLSGGCGVNARTERQRYTQIYARNLRAKPGPRCLHNATIPYLAGR
eukprot:1582225-Lingulodinium_polyedra.AAC.1